MSGPQRVSDEAILKCIDGKEGCLTAAANELGYSKSALTHRINRHGLFVPKRGVGNFDKRKHNKWGGCKKKYTLETLESKYGPWPATIHELQDRTGHEYMNGIYTLLRKFIAAGWVIQTVKGRKGVPAQYSLVKGSSVTEDV